MRVWRRWVFPILMVVIFGVMAAALGKLAFFPDSVESSVGPSAGIADPVVPVARGSIVNELSLPGTVARDEEYPLRAEVNGTVTAVRVAEGDNVAAGQVLFSVKQDSPVKNVDIVAPEAGEVSKLALVKGQSVTVGVEIATLTPARFHVLSTVEPVQLYRLLGAPSDATVTIPGGPAPFVCTGVKVQVAEDSTTSVRCAVPADQTVFSGLPATLDITVGTVSDVLVVPTTAVQGGAETGTVWVDAGDGSEAEERPVTLGVNDGTQVEVVEGLAEGESIRQFVPGFAAPVEEFCYEIAPGQEQCETGMSW